MSKHKLSDTLTAREKAAKEKGESPDLEHAVKEVGGMVRDYMTRGSPRCISIEIPDEFKIEWSIQKTTLVIRFTDERKRR